MKFNDFEFRILIPGLLIAVTTTSPPEKQHASLIRIFVLSLQRPRIP